MNILIIGITGFLGTELAGKLSSDKKNYKVRGTSRSSSSHSDLNDQIEIKIWDTNSVTDEMISACEWADIVINLAGATIFNRWTEKYKDIIYESRVNTNKKLVDIFQKCASDRRPEKFLTASAVGYYGGNLSDKYLDENSPSGDNFLAKVCEDLEKEAFAAKELGIDVVALRTGIVLANSGGAFPLMKLPFKIFIGGPISPGQQHISWIGLSDWLNAVKFIISSEEITGPVNLVAPNPVSQLEFAEKLGAALNRPNWLRVPKFLIKLMLGEEMADNLLLKGQKAIPSKLLNSNFTFKNRKIENLLKSLV
jgi:hypothetical protein